MGQPSFEEEIFWYHYEGPEGITGSNSTQQICNLIATSEDSSPCDIQALEIGNTDTHVLFRWTLAGLEFGQGGAEAYVDFSHRIKGVHADAATEDVSFRLTTEGIEINPEFKSTSVPDMNETWAAVLEEQKDSMLDTEAGQIVYGIPLDLISNLMEDGRGAPWNAFNNTRLKSWVNPVAARANPEDVPELPFGLQNIIFNNLHGLSAEADSIKGIGEAGNRTYVIQPYGDLHPPELPFQVFYDDVEADELQAEIGFEKQVPDYLNPWAAQPLSAKYVYNWTMELDAFEITLVAETNQGSVALQVEPPTEDVEPFESDKLDLDMWAGGTAELNEEFRSVPHGTWKLTIVLDRFEGEVEMTGIELPPLEDGNEGGGSDNGNQTNGNNETATDDVDVDDKDTPAPAVMLVVAATLAILARRRNAKQ